ncbi:Alcohol dehydrogenase, class IV [Quadrisphaera granulorum]|uniref:Alcohol dehydrogenase class IV n=1 Tax=Quadrisphaera granulorum TaxID=317664 RepID=A0A316AVL2_9ACTN|nr:maleylacetate reductase [Quadrisphaera granulorum]PWJ54137.1 alcohol dehydrogenase class IV [Quadrisphaera granulorum]SZE96276.1 Alcohol dehydrogenase, class IV [Quadrisphaera granulorum]
MTQEPPTTPGRDARGLLRFQHDVRAQRVVFATDRAVAAVVEQVRDRGNDKNNDDGARRVLVTASGSSRGTAEAMAEALRTSAPGVDVVRWDGAAQHVPVDIADRARAVVRERGCDLVVAVGGGSVIGLAKAVAAQLPVRVVAVPTTFSGSEATDVWGQTVGDRKAVTADPAVLPAVVVYDAALTVGLPAAVAAASQLNALAHCVDALWGPRADPLSAALAEQGAGLLVRALRRKTKDDDGDGASELRLREDALLGAHLAGRAFASAGSGLHHKVCHVLGGTFGLPHADVHAVVLPHAVAFNAPAAPWAAARLRSVLGERPAVVLSSLASAAGVATSLAQLGLARDDVAAAAEAALPLIPPSNPRPVTREGLVRLLDAAWEGPSALREG